MIKTLVIMTSLWGMWGQPEGSPTPSSPGYQVQTMAKTYPHRASGQYGARPGRWCGWYMRKKLGVSNPKYNVARNWAHWGSPSGPQVGAVVVWRNHVGLIVGQDSKGRWLIESGNDGGRAKTRPWNNLHKIIAYRI